MISNAIRMFYLIVVKKGLIQICSLSQQCNHMHSFVKIAVPWTAASCGLMDVLTFGRNLLSKCFCSHFCNGERGIKFLRNFGTVSVYQTTQLKVAEARSASGFSGLWYPNSRVHTRPKQSGFLGRKNPQHAFLRWGSKALGPMS